MVSGSLICRSTFMMRLGLIVCDFQLLVQPPNLILHILDSIFQSVALLPQLINVFIFIFPGFDLLIGSILLAPALLLDIPDHFIFLLDVLLHDLYLLQ